MMSRPPLPCSCGRIWPQISILGRSFVRIANFSEICPLLFCHSCGERQLTFVLPSLRINAYIVYRTCRKGEPEMMLVRCNPMMNADRSAAYGDGDSCSCAHFQASNANSMTFSVDTMVMVSFFLILTLFVLCGALVRIILAAIFLSLVSVLFYNLSTP